jgi:hypothetical protein
MANSLKSIKEKNVKELLVLEKILNKAVKCGIPTEDFLKLRVKSSRQYLKQFTGRKQEEVNHKMNDFLEGKTNPLVFLSFLREIEREEKRDIKTYFDIFLEEMNKYILKI